MNIHINIPIRLLVRLVRTLERIAHNYEIVHREAIEAAQYDHRKGPPAGRTFYQNDKAIYAAEVEARVREAVYHNESI